MKMKVAAMCGVICLVAASAFAALSKDELKRLNESVGILHELRTTPEKGIPDDLWNKAQCVAGHSFAEKSGARDRRRIRIGRDELPSWNSWSAPVFMQIAKGSWGLQIGAQAIDSVLLVMNKRGVEKLLETKCPLARMRPSRRVPVGRSANAATDAQMSAEMLAYSRSQGLFAGVRCLGRRICVRTKRPTRAPTARAPQRAPSWKAPATSSCRRPPRRSSPRSSAKSARRPAASNQ